MSMGSFGARAVLLCVSAILLSKTNCAPQFGVNDTLVDDTLSGIVNATQGTGVFLTNATQDTMEFLSNATQDTMDFFMNATQDTAELLTNATQDTVEFLTTASQDTADFFTNASQDTAELFNNVTQDTAEFIRNATQGTAELLTNVTQDTAEFLRNATQDTAELLSNVTQELLQFNRTAGIIANATQDLLKDSTNAVTNLTLENGEEIITELNNTLHSFGEMLSGIFGSLESAMREISDHPPLFALDTDTGPSIHVPGLFALNGQRYDGEGSLLTVKDTETNNRVTIPGIFDINVSSNNSTDKSAFNVSFGGDDAAKDPALHVSFDSSLLENDEPTNETAPVSEAPEQDKVSNDHVVKSVTDNQEGESTTATDNNTTDSNTTESDGNHGNATFTIKFTSEGLSMNFTFEASSKNKTVNLDDLLDKFSGKNVTEAEQSILKNTIVGDNNTHSESTIVEDETEDLEGTTVENESLNERLDESIKTEDTAATTTEDSKHAVIYLNDGIPEQSIIPLNADDKVEETPQKNLVITITDDEPEILS